MARRPLPTLADVIAKALVKPVAEWSKRAQRDLAVFSRAIGVAPETFAGYAPSTQRKYVAAAKKGRTAAEERERVRGVRKERAERKKREQRPYGVSTTSSIRNTPQWRELMHIRDELYAEGLNDEAGDMTQTDSIGAHKLYEDESLEKHIEVYGFDYVIDHATNQLAALQQYNQSQGRDRSIGREAMLRRFNTLDQEAFAASAAVEDEDERWYWYHASTLHY